MRKRRWWFAGLAFALLAAGVGTWIWSRPPAVPFAFMKGAALRFIRVDSGSGRTICTTSYHVDGQWKTIQDSAKRELKGWALSGSLMDSLEFNLGMQQVTVVGWEFGTAAHPQTHVLYKRPATASDYPRSWISTVQSWF